MGHQVDMTRLDSKLMYAAAKVRPHPRLAPTLVQRVHRRQQGDWGGKRWKVHRCPLFSPQHSNSWALSFIPSLPLCVCVHHHVASQSVFRHTLSLTTGHIEMRQII
eukprot:scaffold265911_cov18-Prasinocladus_malaysianus.AAC.1